MGPEALECIGQGRGFEQFINQNPLQNGPISRDTMADIVKAVIGAVWLDQEEEDRRNLSKVVEVMETLALLPFDD